jgi:hypothetical protein
MKAISTKAHPYARKTDNSNQIKETAETESSLKK